MKDLRHFSKEDEEADMGIGTMIVFIAMILVSAVAAGLLINTAYEVQQQAEETGKLAIKNVATSFQLVNAMGDRGVDGTGDITALEFKVSLVAGSPETAMRNVIIEITTSAAEDNLIFQDDASQAAVQHEWDDHDATDTAALTAMATSGVDYTAQELRDPNEDFYEDADTIEDDEPNYVVSQGALIRLFIDPSTDIGTQDWIVIKLIPKHGVPTIWSGTAPETFTDRYVPL